MTSPQPGELDEVAVRLLGCLVEKERTTPDDYPLTANALMRAANQSTSRDPVVSYSVGVVESTMARMKEAGLVRFVYSQSNRSTRYRHVLEEAWSVNADELALLALLMLRGAQTPGELKSRSERLASFGDLDAVRAVLDDLAARPSPYVRQLERMAGHKESRWTQLLGAAAEAGAEPGARFRDSSPANVGAALPDASDSRLANAGAAPPTNAEPASSSSVSGPADSAPMPSSGVSGPADAAPMPSSGVSGPADAGNNTARIRALEAEVASLRAAIDEVRVELGLAPSAEAVGDHG